MPQATRSDRAQRRATKIRNQRIALAIIGILLFSLIIFVVYQNATKPSETPVPTSQSATGLLIEDIKVGDGVPAVAGNTVKVNYTGYLTDGSQFDSSYDRNQPFEFTIGAGQVIKGWDEGVVGMKVGGKRKLTIPPELGYGARGAGNLIPPNATLVFEIVLEEIK